MYYLQDYRRFAILYVDDEEKSLKYFHQGFGDRFRILTAPSAAEAYRLMELHRDEIGLLMTDQRMPGEKGVQLLERARQLCPRVVRILVTAHSDLEAAIAAVNTGAIYKYITKPWDPPDLEITLCRALDFFMVQRERDQLLREKLSVLQQMMITDRVVSLGILATGLSHHIRNSLVAVRTFLDLAPTKLEAENVDLDELRNPNFWRDFYTHVQSQVHRITEMLSDLGLASDRPPYSFDDAVSIPQVIREVIAQLAERWTAQEIQVINELPDNLPVVAGDYFKIKRLFWLLFSDEATTLPRGARITVRALPLPTASEEGTVTEVSLEITDNGPGLPEAGLRSVFDPFFVRNANPQEFGINLMACYFLVFHHGGNIKVESPAQQGTTFRITLPTNPQIRPIEELDQDLLNKAFLNETLWEKLISGV
jgi:two-component system probable response regulator PhcQ